MNVPEDLRLHLPKFAAAVGHTFVNNHHAAQALIHSSWVNENPETGLSSNERLEFLGDALLDFVMAEVLYAMEPALSEGDMSRLRSLIVCEASLAQTARRMGIGHWLLMGRGEDLNGGRDRPSILADAMEAVYGAVYLDAGARKGRGHHSHLTCRRGAGRTLGRGAEGLQDGVAGSAPTGWRCPNCVPRGGQQRAGSRACVPCCGFL